MFHIVKVRQDLSDEMVGLHCAKTSFRRDSLCQSWHAIKERNSRWVR